MKFHECTVTQICGAIVVTCTLTATEIAFATNRDLVKVFYDLEVASYCGLVSDAVSSGFHREKTRIMDRGNISNEAMQQARMTAWKNTHEEWQNRGLGGFKGWCQTEGQAAAQRFLAVPE